MTGPAELRIAVIGTSGAGKSSLARALGVSLGAPHVELDAINWRPGWRALSQDDPDGFRAAVAQALAGDRWICDGNYGLVRPLILARATHVVWLDYSRAVVMRRVIWRSLVRALSGRELWAGTGNRESFRRWADSEHPIRWAWSTHARRRAQYAALFASPDLAGKTRLRLRSPREAAGLVACLAR